jgi:hypothetical protein
MSFARHDLSPFTAAAWIGVTLPGSLRDPVLNGPEVFSIYRTMIHDHRILKGYHLTLGKDVSLPDNVDDFDMNVS